MKLTPQTLAKQFCAGEYVNSVDAQLWRQAMQYIASAHWPVLPTTAIATLWGRYGGDIRARVKDDRLILQVLKTVLSNPSAPLTQQPQAHAPAVRLYRGESWCLFDADAIGFCWTRDEALATRYAKGLNGVDSGGVLLTGLAPAAAVLAVTRDHHHDVYICDPHQLQQLSTLALFPKA